MGDDTIYGGPGIDRSIYLGERDDYIIIPPEYTADSSHQIRDTQADRDGIDELFSVEEVQFEGLVYELSELLALGQDIVPEEFALYHPFPNPFNPKTVIRYNVPITSRVNITIYNVKGEIINNLVDQYQMAGSRFVNWNATNSSGQTVPAGVYLYKIVAGNFTQSKKMMLLK